MRSAIAGLALAASTTALAVSITACSGTSATTPPATTAAPPATTAAPPATSATAPPATTTAASATMVSAATNYYRAIVARNYRRAFTDLAPKATGPDGRRLTWPAFLRLASTLDNESGPVTRFSVGAFKSLVVMTVNRKRAGPYHAHLTMTRSKNGWLIAAMDRI